MARYLVVAHQAVTSPELLKQVRVLREQEEDAEFVLLVPATRSTPVFRRGDKHDARPRRESAWNGDDLFAKKGPPPPPPPPSPSSPPTPPLPPFLTPPSPATLHVAKVGALTPPSRSTMRSSPTRATRGPSLHLARGEVPVAAIDLPRTVRAKTGSPSTTSSQRPSFRWPTCVTVSGRTVARRPRQRVRARQLRGLPAVFGAAEIGHRCLYPSPCTSIILPARRRTAAVAVSDGRGRFSPLFATAPLDAASVEPFRHDRRNRRQS